MARRLELSVFTLSREVALGLVASPQPLLTLPVSKLPLELFCSLGPWSRRYSAPLYPSCHTSPQHQVGPGSVLGDCPRLGSGVVLALGGLSVHRVPGLGWGGRCVSLPACVCLDWGVCVCVRARACV